MPFTQYSTFRNISYKYTLAEVHRDSSTMVLTAHYVK